MSNKKGSLPASFDSLGLLLLQLAPLLRKLRRMISMQKHAHAAHAHPHHFHVGCEEIFHLNFSFLKRCNSWVDYSIQIIECQYKNVNQP